MLIKLPKWLKNPRNIILLGLGLGAVLGIAIALATGNLKAGIGGGETVVTSEKTTVGGVEKTVTKTPQDAKTLWDWLNLAGVVAIPVVLAGLGAQLQAQQQKRSEEQSQVEREIADENRQEEVLQNYFDRVSALLVDKNLLAIAARGDAATPEEKEFLDVSVDVIRARTLATLRSLDHQELKGNLIQFLCEADLISKLKVSLAGAKLIGAYLKEVNLSGANLSKAMLLEVNLHSANLSGANLSEATPIRANLRKAKFKEANLSGAKLIDAKLDETDFSGANLSGANLFLADLSNADLSHADLRNADLRADLRAADLRNADLRDADLRDANLIEADLSNADLSHVDLSGAYLIEANLESAFLTGADFTGTDFSGAILKGAVFRGAKGLTKEQLEGKDPPYLCDTKLPEDIDIDPNRDCLKLSSTNEIESSPAAQETNPHFADTPPTTGRP